MPLRVSDDLKECIIRWYYIDMITMEEIRDHAKCSIGLIYNVIRNYRDFGQVRNPFALCTGWPCTLTDEDLIFLNALLEANPSLYLDELQQKLFDI
jgi:transposase